MQMLTRRKQQTFSRNELVVQMYCKYEWYFVSNIDFLKKERNQGRSVLKFKDDNYFLVFRVSSSILDSIMGAPPGERAELSHGRGEGQEFCFWPAPDLGTVYSLTPPSNSKYSLSNFQYPQSSSQGCVQVHCPVQQPYYVNIGNTRYQLPLRSCFCFHCSVVNSFMTITSQNFIFLF